MKQTLLFGFLAALWLPACRNATPAGAQQPAAATAAPPGAGSAGSLDSNTLERLAQQLVDEALEGYSSPEYRPVKKGDQTLYDTAGMARTSVYAEPVPGSIADMNGDGIPDVLFRVTDEGLGGGGNAFGYNYQLLVLDRNYNIQASHSFFGGGKLSMALLNIDTVRDGKIYATYEENGYAQAPDESDALRSVALVFRLKDGRLVETQYEKCAMAAMEKRIFRDDISGKVQATLALDDSYNEERIERYDAGDGTTITAILAGCTGMDLYFSRTIPYRQALENDRTAMHAELLKNLELLSRITRFSGLLEQAGEGMRKVVPGQIESSNYGGGSMHLLLKNNWQAHLFISGNPEQGTFITIRLEEAPAEKELDFWEKLEAKSRL